MVADELCLLKPSGKKNIELNNNNKKDLELYIEKTTLQLLIYLFKLQRIILIQTKGPIPTLGLEVKSHFVLYQTALHCHEKPF